MNNSHVTYNFYLIQFVFFTVTCFMRIRKNWLTFSHYMRCIPSQINGLFTIHSSSHYPYFFFCPFLFHFCELVCSLRYSSMNLLALVVKFLNMLLCFYLNSSLLYASSRIRILNKLYNLPFLWAKKCSLFLVWLKMFITKVIISLRVS